jgi:PD-(D/E)XK nuclease superfamily
MSLAEELPTTVASPFLPGTKIQYAWDATSLEWLKRCPRLYQYQTEGWRAKEENIHLRFGIEFHQTLHDYELVRDDKIEHDEAMFHAIRELMYRVEDWNPDHKYKNRDNLLRSVIGYLDGFVEDKAVTLKLNNGKPAVEVSFNFELDFGPTNDQPYVLCGHLDRVVNFHDEIFIMDRKTTTTTPGSYYWNQFEPNNQMTLYTLAGKVIFETNVKGVMIDSVQIMVDSTRFTRGITYRTQDQLDEWVTDLKYWLRKAEAYAKDDYWPMNDTACDKYGGCMFRHICSSSPSVRQKFLKAEFTKEEPWNPLKVR